MTMRSAIAYELDLDLSILRTQITDRNPNTRQREQEVYPPFLTERSRLTRRQLAQLIQLGREQESGLLSECFTGETNAEKHVVPVLDCQCIGHHFTSSFIREVSGSSLTNQVIASQHTCPLQGLNVHFYPIIEVRLPALRAFLRRLPGCQYTEGTVTPLCSFVLPSLAPLESLVKRLCLFDPGCHSSRSLVRTAWAACPALDGRR